MQLHDSSYEFVLRHCEAGMTSCWQLTRKLLNNSQKYSVRVCQTAKRLCQRYGISQSKQKIQVFHDHNNKSASFARQRLVVRQTVLIKWWLRLT